MTRIAYLDCFSGVSGDMLLGAMLDAGLPLESLRAELAKLRLPGYRLGAESVRRAGLSATRATVALGKRRQHARLLPDILALIEGSDLPAADRRQGALVFHRLGEAEARVHGVDPDSVQLHEVGAVDAIVDVMGAVAGLRLLGVRELYASALPAGGGSARGAHGTLPVPAPATLEIIARAGAPLASGEEDADAELVTPTGAAIVTSLAKFARPSMSVSAVGYGAGARDLPGRPNVLRLWLGETTARRPRGMVLLETNIDDMNPELFGYVQELLFAEGAVDVWFPPIQMKKNRPATLISVLCPREREDAVVRVLLRETSTLGVRVSEVARHEARRESLRFDSSLGRAAVKVKWLEGEPPRVAPEYESCRRLAQRSGRPLAEVYRVVAAEAERLLASPSVSASDP
jgi:uncharacterized protein (TIGR00299 family) protein